MVVVDDYKDMAAMFGTISYPGFKTGRHSE